MPNSPLVEITATFTAAELRRLRASTHLPEVASDGEVIRAALGLPLVARGAK